MAVRSSSAEWKGTLREGSGTMHVGASWEGPYSYASRFESGAGTNPEELIGAAHAGCFSMFLAALLTEAGSPPRRVATEAKVHLETGPVIARIDLQTEVEAQGLTAEALAGLAVRAKRECPVSKALAGGPQVTVTARLA